MPGEPRILLVDDDPAVLELSADVLTAAGFVVVTANDGMAALALLDEDGHFDGLVTDDSMPRLSGRELIIRALVARPGLRCLLTSGRVEPPLGDEGFRVLRKPFRAAALAAAVSVMVAGRE
ncbi:MAG TPA: response regulator [Acetobacteraceae bacterium]|jgi:CheY-like chemotaxis protein